MDRYKNVENQKPELPNGIEIRISSHAPLDNYLRYATNLLQRRGPKEIVLKAMGQAMSNAVIIAETLKTDIPRLYQDTAISSVSTIDETVGGCTRHLDVARTRSAAMISITLSTKKLNVNSPGYQAPSNVDQSKQQYNYQPQQQHPLGQEEAVDNMGNGDNYVSGRGCGKFRGSYATYRASSSYANNNRGGSSANNISGYEDNQGSGYTSNRVSGYAGVGYGRGGFAGGRNYVGRGGGSMGRFSTLKSSESSMRVEDGEIIDIDNPSTSTTQSGTTLRSIFCLKNRDQIKEIEEREDLFILDFDPSDELNIINLSIGDDIESDIDKPSTSTTQSGTTLRSTFCLKNRDQIKEIEEREDCFILDFDPGDELNIVNPSIGDDTESDIDNSSSSTTQSGTTLRSIFCLKNRDQIKEIEERKDCFILDFDPSDELNIVNLSIGDDTESDLCIVAEKGQVACRDYPHPRNSCAKFPFVNTPHESYCGQCYCFVCDLVAPCENWTGIYGHCHAYSNETWNRAKEAKKAIS